MKALTTAIYGKLAGSTLSTAIGGRLYKGRAVDGATYPYIVYKVVSDVPENTFREYLERVVIQFSLFSSASGTTEIEDMFGYLKALYDDCNFSITGQTLLWMRRSNAGLFVEDHTTVSGTVQVWHYAVDYSIMVKVG